jgi:thiol-disulfide isomerase/thioredoxin
MPLRMDSPMPALKGGTDWFNSEPVTIEELAGHTTLVHFWAISCATCKESLSDIAKWVEKFAPQGLKVVAVHMPRMESDTNVEEVKKAIKEYEIKWPCVIDNWHDITDAFENKYVPAFYLFDGDGKMRDFKAGEKAPKMVEPAIERILSEGQAVKEEAK